MSSVNLFTREISIKIVYYGPGLGGKTSSLQYIHRALKTDSRGQLVSLATGVDRTLYFDFLPVKLPKLRGYSIRVQLYTVPGQVHYNSTRKLVLAGCDGVVFVADSQRDRDTANVESFENLRENLAEQGMKPDQVPLVVQYNKRDAPDVLPVEEMAASVNPNGAPAFETVATTGQGVFESLKAITTLVLNDLRRRGLWDGGSSETRQVPTEFDRTDTSIAQRIQSLSEAAEAVNRMEPPPEVFPRRTTRPMATVGPDGFAPSMASGSTPAPAPLPGPTPTSGVSRLLTPRIPQGLMLSGLLPEGPARDHVAQVESELSRGNHAEAARLAGRAFSEASRVEMGAPEVTPVLHALMLGVSGDRYLRFCEIAHRAAEGTATPEDALFTLFFLVDAALER